MNDVENKELLSVIIPVYNTQDTLIRTVESVIEQDWKKLEIILVDDGSPDNAGKICDELAKKYDCIRVQHKVNEGLGYARNTGLSIANGRFIAFLDSDDWIDKEAYSSCIRQMLDEQIDACYFGRKVFRKDGSYSIVDKHPTKCDYSENEIALRFVPRYFGDWTLKHEEMYIRESACCAIYDRKIIEENKIRFLSERDCLSEDLFFNLDFCRKANRIRIITKDYYNQGFNPGSLTKKHDPTRFVKTKGFYEYIKEYACKFPEIECLDQRIRYRMISTIRGIIKKECSVNKGRIITTYRIVEEIINDDITREIFNGFDVSVVNSNTTFFVNLVRHKRIILLLMIYGIKGFLKR